ncbi:MAG TPA: hypothetical protein VGR22_02185 [Thermomicrobiales bacterium]|nr:hypothetical protein [Thermomicrobiales bacterium]
MADNRDRVNQDPLASTRGVQSEEVGDSFDAQMRDKTPERIREGAATNVTPGSQEKEVRELLPQLSDDEVSRLAVLEPGTQLPQGSIFLDLNDLQAGPFKAIGGQEAGRDQRLIAKSETDYEIWNKLAGRDDEPEIERPEREQGS